MMLDWRDRVRVFNNLFEDLEDSEEIEANQNQNQVVTNEIFCILDIIGT